MSTQLAPQVQTPSTSQSPLKVEAEKILQRIRELSDSIARRAYELFEGRGRSEGHDLEDWLRAETELLRPTQLEIVEENDRLILSAEVPGFSAEEINVAVEPNRVLLHGRREVITEENSGSTDLRECSSEEFCRSLGLSDEVDPANATATLKDGVLKLILPKSPSILPSSSRMIW